MIEKELIIKNKTGLHARPAAVFVETADKYQAEVELIFEGINVNAKSIIGVLSLGIGKGDKILLKISGEEEKEAADALTVVVNNKFGENG